MGLKNSLAAILFVGAIALFCPSSEADIIHLKNGEKLEGLIVKESEDEIVIRLRNGTINFNKQEIGRIEKKPFVNDGTGGETPDNDDLLEYKGRRYTKDRFEQLVEKKGLVRYKGEWITEHEKLGYKIDENPSLFDIRKIVGYASPAIVSLTVDDRKLGSGVLIDSSGLFVTNYHVVEGAKKIRVKKFNDKMEYPARVFSYKEFYDLALVSIGGTEHSYLRLADPDKISTGDSVIAMGNPFGLATSATTGIISSIRKLKDFPGAQDANLARWQEDILLIQTDAAINPGNSGGPLLDRRGRIVGINTFGVPKIIAEGLNFAIHAKELDKIYSHYIKK